MNVQPMQMDPDVAEVLAKKYKKKLLEHRAERREMANKDVKEGGKRFRAGRITKSLIEKEDEELAASYAAMANGQKLINISKVLHDASYNDKHLPKLAIAGAHWKECYLRWNNGEFVFTPNNWGGFRDRWGRHEDGIVGIPRGDFGFDLTDTEWRKKNNYPLLPVKAIVPSVPAFLRPSASLKGYHILFEAVWEPAPPVDPILLQHVHGLTFAVLAQWNLTDLERSVLEGRLT